MSTLSYGAFRNRFKQVAVTPTGTETTIYVAGIFEKVTRTSSGTEYRHLIQGGRGTAAIYTRSSGGSGSTAYVHTDHLGSPELITGSSGNVLVRPSFAAYGERRDGSDWDGPPSAGDLGTIANLTRRGFTGHEHLDAVNLIHMNGRVYEPVAGRFLSRDPFIDGFASSQGINGYAYVHNNPLTLTDPSGFCRGVRERPCRRIDGGIRGEPVFNPGVHNERARARHPSRWQNRPNASTRGDPLLMEGGTGVAELFGVGNHTSVTLYLRSFAPWKVFGGGFEGDNRSFTTDVDATARMTAKVVIDVRTMEVISYNARSSPSAFIEAPCLLFYNMGRPPGPWRHPSDTLNPNLDVSVANGTIEIRLWGKNPLTFEEVTPDLDLNLKLWKEHGLLHCQMSGDRFPNAEAFLVLADGTTRMLHTFETDVGKSTGPFRRLPGGTPEAMGRCGAQ